MSRLLALLHQSFEGYIVKNKAKLSFRSNHSLTKNSNPAENWKSSQASEVTSSSTYDVINAVLVADGMSGNFKQPCVVFTGHPSLRFGDVVHFMDLWSSSHLNSIIFIGMTSQQFLSLLWWRHCRFDFLSRRSTSSLSTSRCQNLLFSNWYSIRT